MAIFDNVPISVRCPKCGQNAGKTVAWLKTQANFVCSRCRSAVVAQAGNAVAAIRAAEQALDHLPVRLRQ